MDNSTRELLVQRIENEFENLDSMEDGEDKQKAINNLVALYKLKIEEEKIDAEYHEHCDKCDLEKAQLEEQKLNRLDDIEIKNKDIEFKKAQLEEQKLNRLDDIEIKNKDIEFKKAQLEEQKLDRWDNTEIKNKDIELRKAQLDVQKLDRWVNLGMQVGLSILSIVAYDIWNRRGLKFEETGTITSPMTRNLLSKMLPKR